MCSSDLPGPKRTRKIKPKVGSRVCQAEEFPRLVSFIHQDMNARQVMKTRGLPQVPRNEPLRDATGKRTFKVKKGRLPGWAKRPTKTMFEHEAALTRALMKIPEQQVGELDEAEDAILKEVVSCIPFSTKPPKIPQQILRQAPAAPWPVNMDLQHRREVTYMKRKLRQFRIIKDQIMVATPEQLVDLADNEGWGEVPKEILQGSFRKNIVTTEALYLLWPAPFDYTEVFWLQKHSKMFPWAWSMPAEQAVYSSKLTEYQQLLRAYPSPHAIIWRNLKPPEKRPTMAEIGLLLTNKNPIVDTKAVLLFYGGYRIKDWEPADHIDYSILELNQLVEELKFVAKHQTERFRRLRMAMLKYRVREVTHFKALQERAKEGQAQEAQKDKSKQNDRDSADNTGESVPTKDQLVESEQPRKRRRSARVQGLAEKRN